MTATRNHSWSDPVRPDAQNTLRTCKNCGIVKRSRHEPENDPPHWTEFERHGRRVGEIGSSKTPRCGMIIA